jgi:hypothetical protein
MFKSRRARVVTVAALLAFYPVWWLTAYPRGMLMAHLDNARGHYEVKVYGCLLMPPDEEEQFSKYAQLLNGRYGVDLHPVAGCVVTWQLKQYCSGYNSSSEGLLFEKHGKDIFAECAALARPQQNANEQKK